MKSKISQAFTLTELMIVIAIMAIIAAIAYPTYTNQIMKARRIDAKVSLVELAQLQANYFAEYNIYTDILDDSGTTNDPGLNMSKYGFAKKDCSGGSISVFRTKDCYYELSVDTTTSGNGGFIITATAKENQASDTNCSTFTLNGKSQKDASSEDCW